jgi:hypothetical protein
VPEREVDAPKQSGRDPQRDHHRADMIDDLRNVYTEAFWSRKVALSMR